MKPEIPWVEKNSCREFKIGDWEAGDGVRFSVQKRPTCYRRGPYLLLIEVAEGPGHHLWGCFDDQDQPARNYHTEEALDLEVRALSRVLLRDRGLPDLNL